MNALTITAWVNKLSKRLFTKLHSIQCNRLNLVIPNYRQAYTLNYRLFKYSSSITLNNLKSSSSTIENFEDSEIFVMNMGFETTNFWNLETTFWSPEINLLVDDNADIQDRSCIYWLRQWYHVILLESIWDYVAPLESLLY